VDSDAPKCELSLGATCVIDSYWCCDEPRCCSGKCVHTTEGAPQYGKCVL
jgi:hypothetical protein